MPQTPIIPVPLAREKVVHLIEDYLDKNNLTKKDLAAMLGYSRAQSVSNFLASDPMSLKVLGQWCQKMGYPLEDLLHERPYAAPGTISAVDNDLQQTKDRITALEEEVKTLKEGLEKILQLRHK